jgi:hypothetical protein
MRVVFTVMSMRRVFQERPFEKTVANGRMPEGKLPTSRWSSNRRPGHSDKNASRRVFPNVCVSERPPISADGRGPTKRADNPEQDPGVVRTSTSPVMLSMLRGTFFSIGMFIALWGVSLLFVDKLVLKVQDDPARTPGFRGMLAGNPQPHPKVIDPPDWAAFSMLSIGAVTMLYAVALPKKQ